MAAILTPANKGMSPTNDNEDMAEAVQKLSTMLREQEDPDLQDVELIIYEPSCNFQISIFHSSS